MRNFIYLIFSFCLIGCKTNSSVKSENEISQYSELKSYLSDKKIDLDSDSGFVFFIPGNCISCNPWITDSIFYNAQSLFTISSQPQKYLKNYRNFFYDSKNSFSELSFFQFDPILVKFNTPNQTVTIYKKVNHKLLLSILDF